VTDVAPGGVFDTKAKCLYKQVTYIKNPKSHWLLFMYIYIRYIFPTGLSVAYVPQAGRYGVGKGEREPHNNGHASTCARQWGLRLRKNRSYPRTKYVYPPADVAAAADVAIGAGLGEQAELHLHGKYQSKKFGAGGNWGNIISHDLKKKIHEKQKRNKRKC
jgi:hypothetical protein